MTEINQSDPQANMAGIRIDDGGGESFSLGYDITAITFDEPQYTGYWQISQNFHVYVTKRPNRLNRFMTKFLLGWEWNDT
jgi:hypothetical protein